MTKTRLLRGTLAIAAAAFLCAPLPRAAEKKVRIIQTNSAGDNVHIIDPATNKVVGVIEGIEVNHGAAAAPDGSRIYVSNEADSTLDVVDSQTLKVVKKVPLSGHPNNIAIGRTPRSIWIVQAGCSVCASITLTVLPTIEPATTYLPSRVT